MRILRKFSRGSILAYSLILLGIVLTASIGMMAASVTNLKSVSSSDKSMNAFQIADSGSQAVVRMLKEATGNKLQDVSGVTCDGGDAVVKSPEGFLGGSYKALFQDSDGKTLACNDSISDVASVKSVGSYSDTARAVQVAVAAGGASGITGGCKAFGTYASTQISSLWGKGCKPQGSYAGGVGCSVVADANYECGSTFYSGDSSGSGSGETCICIAK